MLRVEMCLCGDVMTGRGVDQILPHPSEPELYESYLHDARDYVALVERTSGPIARPTSFGYVWGDALDELERAAPDVRIVNLETSVTRSSEAWPGKGINYRMHPRNVPCLTAAKIDVCVLANNHVLDWGHAGLVETLETLHLAGLTTAGAGRTRVEAEAVANVDVSEGRRVHVLGVADRSSGVPSSWEAQDSRSGVALLGELDEAHASAIAVRFDRVMRPGDVAVVSIHWGENWGYEVPDEQVRFAHALVDRGIDVIHGHSSHHPRPIEIYRGKPILYGCGDLINDYEGIRGHEEFRDEQRLLYFVAFERGELAEIAASPLRIRKMRLERASRPDALWLKETLARISRPYGTAVEMTADGSLVARAGRAA